MNKYVYRVDVKAHKLKDHFDDITHDTWVQFSRLSPPATLHFKRSREHIIKRGGREIGELKKVNDQIMLSQPMFSTQPVTDASDGVVFLVYVQYYDNEDHEGDRKESILKIGQYLEEYVDDDFEARPIYNRIRVNGIQIYKNQGENFYRCKLKVNNDEEWVPWTDFYFTRYAETLYSRSSEGYQLKL